MSRLSGMHAHGGGRSASRSAPDDRYYAVGPVPAHVGLLRAYLAKRRHLSQREVDMAQGMLERAMKRPLSGTQHAWLVEHAAMVGAVYEEPPVPAGEREALPWGVLPKRPPGRR